MTSAKCTRVAPTASADLPVANSSRDLRQDAITEWIKEVVRTQIAPNHFKVVAQGRELFEQEGLTGVNNVSCATCHGGAQWTRSLVDYVAPPSPNLAPAGDVVATLKASTHFTILVKAIESTNLAATLSKAPNLTLFAPTDEAFRALPAGQLDRLLLPANVPLLQKVVIYHLVNLPIESAKIRGAKGPVKTVANTDIQLDGSGEVLLVNNADIIQADVKAANGVIIHAIDKVLLPADVNLASGPALTASNGGAH